MSIMKKLKEHSFPALLFLSMFMFFYIFWPYVYRAYVIEKSVSIIIGESATSILDVMTGDALLISLVLAAFVLVASLRSTALALGVFLVAVIIQSLVIADVILFTEFSQRLIFSDVQKYGPYVLTYLLDYPLEKLFWNCLVIVLLLAAKPYIFKKLRQHRVNLRMALPLLLLAFVPYILQLTNSKPRGYVHGRFYLNFFDLNRTLATEHRQYSDSFMANAKDPFEKTCHPAEQISGPVIIYMVESLSAYHSKYFGGQNDWTPKLDKIAENHMALKNFFANGFTTEDGEIALLTTEYPLFAPSSYRDGSGGGVSFDGYWSDNGSIPSVMSENGYSTYFLTPSDRNFSRTGEWAESIGFDFVEGSEGAFYNGMKRYHFDAAPDEALVDRIDAVIDTVNGDYFIFAKSTSGHHPHTDPVTGKKSEELVVRYVDEQIDRLYNKLDERGFFETGHLIIVGDHRAMLPLTRGEVDTWDVQEAFARVPAVIISNSFLSDVSVAENKYSQVNLSLSLKGAISGQECNSEIGKPIADYSPDEPRYFIHRRGDIRNALSIFSEDKAGTVIMDGDKTRFTESEFSPEEQEKLIDYVNFRRIMAKKNPKPEEILEVE